MSVFSVLKERTTVREIPCSGCSWKRGKPTGKRGSGMLRYTHGPDKGKLRTCSGCDGTGYEYECLVLSKMEFPNEL
jgi:hypothetical protein